MSLRRPLLHMPIRPWLRLGTVFLAAAFMAGCSPIGLVITAVSVATDTSVTWDITKHLYGKLTEGDPIPCFRLNSVQSALSLRCGQFSEGSLKTQDIADSGLQECALTIAAHDPRLWPVLPELVSKGALPARCTQPPLVVMAQMQGCADFSQASPEALAAIAWLARTDPRSVHHDVMRMLSCPAARTAGLSDVLDEWQAAGALPARALGFSALGALHPDYLDSAFAHRLEATGHLAQAALGWHEGRLSSGFEEALRINHWAALDWWLRRAPQLINNVPASQPRQMPWVPLARVLSPQFLAEPGQQEAAVRFLLARGANPWQRLPHSASQTVVNYAQWLRSTHVALLEKPALTPASVAAAPVVVPRTALRPRVLQVAQVSDADSR